MARYRMEDGTVLDTTNARASWPERRDASDIGRVTGSPYHRQTLYRSRKGRYYIETITDAPFGGARCEWVSPQNAAAWLLMNGYPLPRGLDLVAGSITE